MSGVHLSQQKKLPLRIRSVMIGSAVSGVVIYLLANLFFNLDEYSSGLITGIEYGFPNVVHLIMLILGVLGFAMTTSVIGIIPGIITIILALAMGLLINGGCALCVNAIFGGTTEAMRKKTTTDGLDEQVVIIIC
jgi:hypothetical protein